MTDVFISYARNDRKRVRLIALGLTAEGFSVWWDPEIKPGARWNDVLRRALEGATVVVTCWSPESAKSRWVIAETTHASNEQRLVPCTVRSCHPPIPFNMIQSADLSHWRGNPDDPDWLALLQQVKRLVDAKRRIPPAAPPPGEAKADARADGPARYTRSRSRGRIGSRLGQTALAVVTVGAVFAGGLFLSQRQIYTPPAPPIATESGPPVQEAALAPASAAAPPRTAPDPLPPPPHADEIADPPAPLPDPAHLDAKPASPAAPAPAATPAAPTETGATQTDFQRLATAVLQAFINRPRDQTAQQLDQCLSQMAQACTSFRPRGYPNDYAVDGRFSDAEMSLLNAPNFPRPGQSAPENLQFCQSALRQGQGGVRASTPLAMACASAMPRTDLVIR